MNIKKVQEYFFRVIGIEMQILPLKSEYSDKLNFRQKKLYQFYEAKINDNHFIIIFLNDEHQTPYEIKSNIEFIKNKLNRKVIIAKSKINSYDRMRLIKYKIGFIIPNKHLYIPEMLIDLRESFNIERTIGENFAPSTQFILIFHLLKQTLNGNTPNEVKAIINKFEKNVNKGFEIYSRMTINRVFNELENFNICSVERKNGTKYLFFPDSKKNLFDKAKKYMLNPVSKKLTIYESPDKLKLKFCSGLTALSEYTLISPEHIKTYAIYKKKFKKNELGNNEKFSEYFNLELWHYSPLILSLDNKNVDPISLYFTLKDSKDERIEKSLENMLKDII
jgi:hypothetical protein